jgi:hypothetical protein
MVHGGTVAVFYAIWRGPFMRKEITSVVQSTEETAKCSPCALVTWQWRLPKDYLPACTWSATTISLKIVVMQTKTSWRIVIITRCSDLDMTISSSSSLSKIKVTNQDCDMAKNQKLCWIAKIVPEPIIKKNANDD